MLVDARNRPLDQAALRSATASHRKTGRPKASEQHRRRSRNGHAVATEPQAPGDENRVQLGPRIDAIGDAPPVVAEPAAGRKQHVQLVDSRQLFEIGEPHQDGDDEQEEGCDPEMAQRDSALLRCGWCRVQLSDGSFQPTFPNARTATICKSGAAEQWVWPVIGWR